eukprot:snap_masked-scaffold_21-processed-gene-0.15-mRNA-1 protein AED:1.00 eAED:1.00 QI:0/-1/0/0/-1/1/1/0/579
MKIALEELNTKISALEEKNQEIKHIIYSINSPTELKPKSYRKSCNKYAAEASRTILRESIKPASNRLNLEISSIGRKIASIIRLDNLEKFKTLIFSPTSDSYKLLHIRSQESAYGQTLLHLAASNKSTKILKFLLNFPKELISTNGENEIENFLIKVDKFSLGFDIFVTDSFGLTAFHYAARKLCIEIIEILLLAAKKRGLEVLGEKAPVDLGGLSPIAYCLIQKPSEKRTKIKNMLQKLGDPVTTPAQYKSRTRKRVLRKSGLRSGKKQNNTISVEFGASEKPGGRILMEDRHIIELSILDNTHLFAVFDGHGGEGVANYLHDNLPQSLIDYFSNIEVTKDNLKKFCIDFDNNMKNESKFVLTEEIISQGIGGDKAQTKLVAQDNSGSTAVSILVRENNIFIINIGDSRCIYFPLGYPNKVKQITTDHKPDEKDIQTKNKIESFGGKLEGKYVKFKKQSLGMTRAFGDFIFKQEGNIIDNTPDIFELNIDNDWNVFILASDGIWDVVSNIEVAKYIDDKIKNKKYSLKDIGDSLIGEVCIPRGSEDNSTIIIVLVKKNTEKSFIKDITGGIGKKLFTF